MISPRPADILLVEDDPHDVELTLRALKKARLSNRIHVARDGADALDYLCREGAHSGRAPGEEPSLVLLDLKLPKVDGLGVLRRLKSDGRTREIPVVVLTSSKEESDIAAAYKLGVNSYIVKPVDFEQFSETARQLGYYWLLVNRQPAESASAPAS